MKVKQISSILPGGIEILSYLLYSGKEGILVDPIYSPEILDKISNLRIYYIIYTHAHGDHILGNEKIREKTHAKIVIHEKEKEFITSELGKQACSKLGFNCEIKPDLLVKDGDVLKAGNISLKILHTPGHTPGSICILTENYLFTGDTLFVEAIGRTDLPGGDFNLILNSIKTKILNLPEETIVYPGHDYGGRFAKLSEIKKVNYYIVDFLL